MGVCVHMPARERATWGEKEGITKERQRPGGRGGEAKLLLWCLVCEGTSWVERVRSLLSPSP
eukprot:1917585-Prymnesium_polylepis.1